MVNPIFNLIYINIPSSLIMKIRNKTNKPKTNGVTNSPNENPVGPLLLSPHTIPIM